MGQRHQQHGRHQRGADDLADDLEANLAIEALLEERRGAREGSGARAREALVKSTPPPGKRRK